MPIDAGTTVLLQATGAVAASSALFWALFWLAMRMVRKTSPWLCAGNGLLAISLFLLSVRHDLPLWLGYWASDTLGIAGIGICFVGIHAFARRKLPVAELGVVIVFCAWIMWRPDPGSEAGWIWRAAAYSAGGCYLSLRAGLSGYRALKSEMGSWPSLALLTPIFGVTVALGSRLLAVTFLNGTSANLDSGDAATRSFMWGALALTLFLNIGVFALAIFRLILKIRFLSVRDPLTGALNRRALMAEFEQESLRAARHKKGYSAIMVDLDHFKAINDTWGHAAGDAALKAATLAMRECLREIDSLARWGGEEFCCLLPMTPADGAMVVAERMRARLKRAQIPWGDQFIVLSASFGVAGSLTDEQPPEEVIRRADQALYQAKRLGRDQSREG